MQLSIPVNPMGKPRMTQRDKWKKRPIVERYHAYCDKIREQVNGDYLSGGFGQVYVLAYIKMPKSWPKSKKSCMYGRYHRQKPDADNILKGVIDALFKDDSIIWHASIQKFWEDKDEGFGLDIFIE